MEFVDLGSAPAAEASVGSRGKRDWKCTYRQCRAYVGQLRRIFGPAPSGAGFSIRCQRHRQMLRLYVVCWYDADDEPAVDYAFRCAVAVPAFWDDLAITERELPP